LEAIERETEWGKRPLPPNHGRGLVLRRSHIGAGKTELSMKLLPDGKIEVLYATPDQGSGSATVVRRLGAATLSVEPERIVIRYGTTGEAFPDPGSGASRVTRIVGHATVSAATDLRKQLEELAAEVMGWPSGLVRLNHDRF